MPVNVTTLQMKGHEIKIQQFLAARGTPIMAKFMKLALPTITGLFKGVKKEEGKSALDQDVDITGALAALAGSIEPNEFLALMLDMLSGTFIDNRLIDEAAYNEFFTGNYFFAFRLVAEVVKANGFLDLSDIGELLSSVSTPVSPTN